MTLDEYREKVLAIREARDWKQFHNPKDMALSLVLEATETLELFQWKKEGELNAHVEAKREAIGEELADVLYWVVLMSHDFGIDLLDAANKKLAILEKKYPVEKSKGVAKKWTELI